MASYQRTALFILFDAIETDLVNHIRNSSSGGEIPLTPEERDKARGRIAKLENSSLSLNDDNDVIYGLDLGDKYSLLLRMKSSLPASTAAYFSKLKTQFDRAVSVRNAVMHSRPLTTQEYAFGFAFANELVRSQPFWPELGRRFREYNKDPHAFLHKSIALIEEPVNGEAINNLPIPDYDDTGFVPRPDLESELKRKILSRHPVITILGDGGNGKTALTLQVLYNLLSLNDHTFDAIIWTTAKTSRLGIRDIESIEGAITDSLGVFRNVADQFESGDDEPLERVRRLLLQNKVLLVIDNLETVLDDRIKAFAEDVPGESKVVFTSRIPLGSDLSMTVGEFTLSESKTYLRRLIEAYAASALRSSTSDQLERYARRLGNKPLLLKWFVIGVMSGLDPERIIANPDVALKFCLENVVDSLGPSARRVAAAMTAIQRPLSLHSVEHIVNSGLADAENGLSELFRYALVEQDRDVTNERAFFLRPFVRSYLSRVIGVTPEDTAIYIRRNKRIDAMFQEAQAFGRGNPYGMRNYVVRSRSEALAANDLRRAVGLSMSGRQEEADNIIADLRISMPDYFEVPRVEAFIRREQGDFARVADCYEHAIDLEPGQPQLPFFYAGFLMRIAEGDAAARWFERALAIDRDPLILREAARNEFSRGDFPKAQNYLDEAFTYNRTNWMHEVVLIDLQVQLFTRKSEFLLHNGDFSGALSSLKSLMEFLGNKDRTVFDEKLVRHIMNCSSAVRKIRNHEVFGRDKTLGDLEKYISDL